MIETYFENKLLSCFVVVVVVVVVVVSKAQMSAPLMKL
jgi:hypothetical protein